jgi:uncharacterized membrane protein
MILDSYTFSRCCALLFVLLNILDGHSTYLVLKPNHYNREKNPIARWIFKKFGVLKGILLLKGVLLTALIYLMFTEKLDEPHFLNILLIVMNLFFAWVVVHNYRVYQKVKKIREIVHSSHSSGSDNLP